MRTLTLFGILATLLVLAFKQPGQSFPEAAMETGNRAFDVVSSFTTDPRPALKESPTSPPVADKVRTLKNQVARLKEKYGPKAGGAGNKASNTSNVWVMPPSKLESGPAPEAAPVRDVEVSVLAEPPAVPGSGETETPVAGESHQENHEEVARLLEESARLLQDIK